MKLNHGLDVILEANDAICITAHDAELGGMASVGLHGYGSAGGAFDTWGVRFLVCQKHVAAIQKLLVTLEEMRSKQGAEPGADDE